MAGTWQACLSFLEQAMLPSPIDRDSDVFGVVCLPYPHRCYAKHLDNMEKLGKMCMCCFVGSQFPSKAASFSKRAKNKWES